MKRALFLFATLLLLAAIAFAMGSKQAKEKKSHADSTRAHQGISGRVEIWEGNFMPMVDPAKAEGQIRPAVGRRVRVHEPVKMNSGMTSAKRDTILTNLVAETVSDSAGGFFLRTPTGLFSVFVEDSGGWYYNGWNGDGVQGAVTVDSGKVTNIVIKITTKATY